VISILKKKGWILNMAMKKKGMAAGKMVKKPVAAPIKKKKK
jgi:hypothetical protein